MKRPMIYWASLFILGEMISLQLPMIGIGCCVTGVLSFLLGIPFFMKEKLKSRGERMVWYMGIVFLFLGVLSMFRLSKDIQILNQAHEKEVWFHGEIIQVDEKESTTRYIIKLKEIKMEDTGYFIRRKICYVEEGEKRMEPGYRIEGRGVGKAYERATNPGGYDEKSYMFSSGIYLKLESGTITKMSWKTKSFRWVLYQVRVRLQENYHQLLSPKDASLAIAMVLGEKNGLDKDVKELYQNNGIAHLIAISGLHIAMIGGTLYRILRKMVGGFKIPVFVGIGFIVMYGVMTGLSGATCRAVIMLTLSLLADLTGRKYDVLSAVNFAFVLMLLENPYQITQTGFLLSYGAIFGIAWINPIWKIWFEKLPKWSDAWFVSLSVQIVLTPIMLFFFYEIPVYSIFLNMIVIPCMNVLLADLILGGLIGLFHMGIAKVLIIPSYVVFRLYEALCNISERMPGNVYCTGRPSFLWIFIYYGMILFLLYYSYQKKIKRSRKILGVGAVFLLILMCIAGQKNGNLMVCMFDMGQGDGIYIKTRHNHHIMMDGGSSSQKKVGTYVLENGLKYYGCNRLDYVFVSHSDLDHYSGIQELLEGDEIQIQCLILPDIKNPDSGYQKLESLAIERGCQVRYMKKGDALEIDGVFLSCFNPERKEYEDKNSGSLVFGLTYENFHMLLTGDMDTLVEEQLMEEEWIRENTIEVLKVAHHGSDSSSSLEFLEKLHPEYACISVGSRNRYGHPVKRVLDDLNSVGANVIRTDEEGAIWIETTGKRMQVFTYKKDS